MLVMDEAPTSNGIVWMINSKSSSEAKVGKGMIRQRKVSSLSLKSTKRRRE